MSPAIVTSPVVLGASETLRESRLRLVMDRRDTHPDALRPVANVPLHSRSRGLAVLHQVVVQQVQPLGDRLQLVRGHRAARVAVPLIAPHSHTSTDVTSMASG